MEENIKSYQRYKLKSYLK